MKVCRTGLAVATVLLLASVPTTLGVAQTQVQPRVDGPSPEVRARLQDGRMAMIKEALKLNDAQLKLWAPVEAQFRANFAARQRLRADRRDRLQQRAERPFSPDRAGRPSLAERLDRKSQRMTERAERAKALADAFRPFYASLSDEQKAVAGLVLRPAMGQPGLEGRPRFMRRASGVEQR